MPIPRIHPLAAMLWLVAVAIGIAGLYGHLWALPCAGFLILFAGLLSGGLAISLPVAAATSGWWLYQFFSDKNSSPEIPVSFAVIATVLGIAAAFLSILTNHKEQTSSGKVCAKLCHIVVVSYFIAAGFLFSDRFLTAPIVPVFATALAIFTVVLIFEILSKLLSRVYTPRQYWPDLSHPGAFFFYRWLGPEWRDCLPRRKDKEDEFSLKLSEMWMGPIVKRSLPWLVLAVAALVFLGTSMHEISPRFHGVRHTFGKWGDTSLSPGVHLSFPAPFGGIKHVDTGSIYEIVLGFRSDSGKPILWERAHYEGETMSLVGNGDDFLSISVPTHYRISDPADYLRSSMDVQTLIKDLGERILLRLTLPLSAAEIMTTAREPLRADFQKMLQQELDAENSGIEIVAVFFRDIHPPVEVAPFFQAVVSAMEDKEAYIYAGEAYHGDVTARARGTSASILHRSKSSAEGRLMRVKGDAERFTTLANSRAKSPALYDLKEGFEVFDKSLGGAKKVVVDEKFRTQMPTTLDMRRVLNPDFVNSAPPAPQSLIPSPSKRLDDFDRSIEGYLRMDRGELPAVNHSSPNPDNLLENSSQ